MHRFVVVVSAKKVVIMSAVRRFLNEIDERKADDDRRVRLRAQAEAEVLAREFDSTSMSVREAPPLSFTTAPRCLPYIAEIPDRSEDLADSLLSHLCLSITRRLFI
jgi:uncharacterized membrane protein